MTRELPKVREWRDVDLATFQDRIVPENRPAVLKALVSNWPAVQAGLRSPRALCDYIKQFDSGRPVETLFGDPSIGGRFFYRDDLLSVNFERRPEQITSSLGRLLPMLDDAKPPAIFIQSASVPDFLPNFSRENTIDLPDRLAIPRIW